MPGRTNAHGCLVITSEDTREVIFSALVEELGVDAHCLQIWVRNNIVSSSHFIISSRQFPRCAGVVDTDVGSTRHRSIITTGVGTTEGATMKIDVCTGHMGFVDTSDDIVLAECYVPLISIVTVNGITIVAITSAKETTNKDMLVTTFIFRCSQNKGADILQSIMV